MLSKAAASSPQRPWMRAVASCVVSARCWFSIASIVALGQFGNLWEPRAPQHGEAEQHKEKVVEQEARLAGDERFEFVFAPQMIFVFEEEKHEDGDTDDEEPREPASDR